MRPTVTSAFLALALLICCSPAAHGYVLDKGACAKPHGLTLATVCAGRVKGLYCWPCDTTKYVKCHGDGINELKTCTTGRIFDYDTHACQPPLAAHPCQNSPCPSNMSFGLVVPAPGVSAPLQTPSFADPGNYTMVLNQTDSFYIICPVQGHCSNGMYFKVTVNQLLGHTPVNHSVMWMEQMTNSKLSVVSYPDLEVAVGDTIYLYWPEPPHSVAIVRPELMTGSTLPELPQPTYICPDTLPFPFGAGQYLPESDGGFSAVASVTIPINATGAFGLVCTIPNHCRNGMYFTVTATAAPPGSSPANYTVNWGDMTMVVYPDLAVHVGDSLIVSWNGQLHNLFKIDVLDKYPVTKTDGLGRPISRRR